MMKNLNCPLTDDQISKMIEVAKETREFAFSHRSMHKIGASILTNDGEIFGGCNIESVISGLGTCAERCAVDHMVAHGIYDVVAVCTVDSSYTPTCGACLQYILLFSQVSNREIWFINGDLEGNFVVKPLSELLPEGYKTKSNLDKLQSYNHNKQ